MSLSLFRVIPDSCITFGLHINFTLPPRGPSPPGDPLLQRTFSSRGPSPPEDLLLLRNSPCLACRRFTLSCCAIHLVSPYGDSPCPPGDPLLQRTFSSRGPSLACRRFTLSCCAIHLVSPDGDSPCEYLPVRSTAASLGNCSCIALSSPVHGLVLPTVQ